jgi:carbamoyl-phosphate synthase large subunit
MLAATGSPRPRLCAQALRLGMSAKDICEVTKFDPWFIAQLQQIIMRSNG